MDDRTWERLLESIRENNVVPVLGARLLVGADGQTSIQRQIAMCLLQGYDKDPDEVSLTPFRELNDAVSYLKGSVDLQDLYFRVHSAIREVTAAKDFVIPEPIRQLSEIVDFRVLVTLTPDDLLARSLRRRCAVNEIVHSPNLPDTEESDLPRDWRSRPGEAYVLYLFGKSRSVPMFAIHEEDVLEYAHNMITRTLHVPTAFLNEIQERNLLLIGCNFPEWLSRFFLRATNQRRLSEREKGGWLIEPLQPEESLTCFLRRYSRATEIFSQPSPAAFVAELRARWGALHEREAKDTARAADQTVPRGAMFFISYSRKTDLPRAEQFYQALMRQGLSEGEVWFDRHSIEPGSDFQRWILDGIRSCRYFVPLLSSATNDREEGFVFFEWNEANARYGGMNREFVFPVIVDADFEPERYKARPVLKWTDERLDFGHAPGGVPDGRLEAKIKKLVREIRKEARPS